MSVQKKYFLPAISLLFIAFLFSCDDTPTSDSEIDPIGSEFDLIVESSSYVLSSAHESHIYGRVGSNFFNYIPVFDLKIKLNEPSRRDEITKIIIYDNESYGWEFSKGNLENYYSTIDSTYNFDDLVLRVNNQLSDRLFFVRVYGQGNLSSRDYEFVLKMEAVAPVGSYNYWTSSEKLEMEYFAYINNYQQYNPLLAPDSVSLTWLDENKNVVGVIPQTKDQLQYHNNRSYDYTNLETGSIPEEAMYAYSTFSEERYNSQHQVLTPIDPILSRLPDITEFFDLSEGDQKLIFSDDEVAIFLTPDENSQNGFSKLHVFDLNSEAKLFEFIVFGRFYDENILAHFNKDQNNLYFFDQNGEYSFFNFDTESKTNLGISTNYQYNNYTLPFGDFILFITPNTSHIYDFANNSLEGINTDFNLGFRNFNAYYYSEVNNALYMGESRGEYFFKISTSDSLNFFGELNFRDNNIGGYSRSNLKLHYSTSDTSLIHGSGASFSLKESVNFTENSALITTPFISAYASGWIDQEQLLIVLDNQSGERIRVLKKTGNTFTEYGYLETFGSPLDIFIHDQTIKISSYYNQGSSRDPKTILVSYSLDDIVHTSEMEKVNSMYKRMTKVSF